MGLGWLRRFATRHGLGAHFAAVVFMGPLAAVAISGLREIHLVSPSPIWLIPTILVGGQVLTTTCGLWWDRSPSRLRLHTKIAMQTLVVTGTVYATGWGPALAIGLAIIGEETLTSAGSSSQRAVVGWT